ncbi:MAG TPA: ABC transporter ATP-binding protein [Candidatus Limnocylindrales bacterium]|nr:ABC transporter ATP-binding protein [Candidatus Limnocylindrales bacterium]
MNLAIRAENLGKMYQIGPREPYKALRDVLAHALYAPFRAVFPLSRPSSSVQDSRSNRFIWALKEVSFEIERGEVVGIIGRNGAGKSTLLKILSRITEPTEGSAIIYGRVGSLLEVGTGFHNELTGRENIYLNGSILGMKKAEIDRKFDEIVVFAEIEKFIDTPVKYYSSGMYVRLAFAVAAHLEPEILVVDEVLAVGDMAFQKKCLGKMGDVAKEGRTVLFVSHNMAAIARLCKRGILLEKGRVTCIGPVEDVISKYQMAAAQGTAGGTKIFAARTGTGLIRFKEVAVFNQNGESWLYSGCAASIKMELEAVTAFHSSNVKIGIGINGPYGDRLITLLNRFDPNAQAHMGSITNGTVVMCNLPRLLLRPGIYYLSLYIDINGEISDQIKDALSIEVHEADFYGTGVMPSSSQGPFLLDQTWHYFPMENNEIP